MRWYPSGPMTGPPLLNRRVATTVGSAHPRSLPGVLHHNERGLPWHTNI